MSCKNYFNEKYNDKVMNEKPKKKKKRVFKYRNPYFDRMNSVLIGEHERMQGKELKSE